MVQEKGVVPNPLTEEQLRKLVLDAMNTSTYAETLETYHALYGHMDRNITHGDVIHGLQSSWNFERPPSL